MKVLLVHPHEVFSEEEPWTSRILNIALELTYAGHDVKLVHFPLRDNPVNQVYRHKDIEIIPLSRKLGVGIFFRNIIRLCKLAKWADIVHFQKCYYYSAIPSLLAAFISDRPVHYDWDDWEFKIYFYPKRQSRLTGVFLWLLEFLLPYLVDTVSVSSERLRQLCINRGIFKDRIFKAPVGADLRSFNPFIPSDKVRSRYNINNLLVIYVGQLHGAQYAELFIQAAHCILNSHNNATFMIVGGGYRLPFLKDMADTLALGRKLIFTGAVPHDEVSSYIAASDIAVACFEKNDITMCKSPLKIAEYMACGKAIVASNVGEIRNMVGGAGIVTLAGDVESLTRGIMRLMDDKGLRETLGTLSRKRSEEKYNWNFTTANLIKAYNTAFYLRNKSICEIIVPIEKLEKSNYDPLALMDYPALVQTEERYFVEFELFIRYSGFYDILIKYSSYSKRSCEVYFDDEVINYMCLEEITGDSDSYKWSKVNRINIDSNFHRLKIRFHNVPSKVSHLKFVKLK
jgi:glycosyltransferase involved in cell wall biosynthesis